MGNHTQKWILHQIKSFRKQTSSAPVLPFTELLIPELVNGILVDLEVTFRERIYPPFLTLCVFLWQVLSEDHSCREAVARLMAFRMANGQKPCSPDTNPYCRARKRLPEKLFQLLVQKVGKWLQEIAPEGWRFHGRRVKSVDGTTVSMPDTPENQKAYPQSRSQEPGVGFPIARLVVLFCVATGAVLLDAEVFTREELADVYNIRWRAEIDLRSLKTVMEMEVLRCKTPEMVRKEIWAHLLAYNLIRTVIAKAAEAHKRRPHEISFKGAMQTINSFRDYMLMDLTSDWYVALLNAIAFHAVGDRPDRYEPRARKRRPKPYKLLQVPRDEARKRKPGKTYD